MGWNMKRLDRIHRLKKIASMVGVDKAFTTLGDLIEVGKDIENPDFYFQRQGSVDSIGKVSKHLEKKTDSWWGVKVKESAKDKLDAGYLYYLLMHIGGKGYWKSLARGTTNLQSIRKEDLLSIPIG